MFMPAMPERARMAMHPQSHHKHILDLLDIIGQTGYQRACAVGIIQVLKENSAPWKKVGPQITGKS